MERLRADYDRNYFLTGDIDVPLYTEDCEFADPFTSFRGRQRFVQNLKPFGFDSEFQMCFSSLVKLFKCSGCELFIESVYWSGQIVMSCQVTSSQKVNDRENYVSFQIPGSQADYYNIVLNILDD